MAALKWARALLKKEQAQIDAKHPSITPLDSHVEKHLTIPIEATEPVKETVFVVKDKTPLERAVEHLRQGAFDKLKIQAKEY